MFELRNIGCLFQVKAKSCSFRSIDCLFQGIKYDTKKLYLLSDVIFNTHLFLFYSRFSTSRVKSNSFGLDIATRRTQFPPDKNTWTWTSIPVGRQFLPDKNIRMPIFPGQIRFTSLATVQNQVHLF